MILCERFPGLDPLTIGEYRAVEVFKLVRSLNTYIDNHKEDNQQATNNYADHKGKPAKKKYSVKVMDS